VQPFCYGVETLQQQEQEQPEQECFLTDSLVSATKILFHTLPQIFYVVKRLTRSHMWHARMRMAGCGGLIAGQQSFWTEVNVLLVHFHNDSV
jgi:hypothetical protein